MMIYLLMHFEDTSFALYDKSVVWLTRFPVEFNISRDVFKLAREQSGYEN